MNTKKFWCHYIGSDGNTPKRRSIELFDLSELLPNIDNEHCKSPLWYEIEGDYYVLYAQLNDKVAVWVQSRVLSKYDVERLLQTDADIETNCKKCLDNFLTAYPNATDERKEKEREYCQRRIVDDKKSRDRAIEELTAIQDYSNYLLSGDKWICAAAIRAFEEAESPILSGLKEIRAMKQEEREARAKERMEAVRKEREEKARKEAEEAAKEEGRLKQEEAKFRNGEKIAGEDVVTLCRRYGIAIHLRTVHNLQQVIIEINGKGNCQYWKQRGKRIPTLDGCYKTARELYDYLQKH